MPKWDLGCVTGLAVNLYICLMKYKSPDSQGDILPNLLGLTTVKEINESEFEGFLKAEIYFTEKLSARTKFDAKYILGLHKMALSHLYSFAGKYRLLICLKEAFLLRPQSFYQKL